MKIDLDELRKIASSRKIPVETIIEGCPAADGYVIVPDAATLDRMAKTLIVPRDMLMAAMPRDDSDLDAGIRIARADQGFRITSERGGAPYYTYQHLATTKAAPELMALKLTLHCRREDGIVLNEGHESKELVYVLNGRIRVDWEDKDGQRHTAPMGPGDSVYVDCGVPHSFSSYGEPAEVLAINYGRM